eukprot:10688769-Alexandrium_andersonii.AAC.1
MGQTAFSAARNLQNFGAPLSRGGRRRRRASGARICIGGLRISADSEPRRGPLGPFGELGLRPPM